mmetsp:Transcript_20839/g.52771  ORF Transcript_20839/g.52771 Transcript_20839/m.52771 type:complete len:287 (-) Transcript_20839:142-1002(-)
MCACLGCVRVCSLRLPATRAQHHHSHHGHHGSKQQHTAQRAANGAPDHSRVAATRRHHKHTVHDIDHAVPAFARADDACRGAIAVNAALPVLRKAQARTVRLHPECIVRLHQVNQGVLLQHNPPARRHVAEHHALQPVKLLHARIAAIAAVVAAVVRLSVVPQVLAHGGVGGHKQCVWVLGATKRAAAKGIHRLHGGHKQGRVQAHQRLVQREAEGGREQHGVDNVHHAVGGGDVGFHDCSRVPNPQQARLGPPNREGQSGLLSAATAAPPPPQRAATGGGFFAHV